MAASSPAIPALRPKKGKQSIRVKIRTMHVQSPRKEFFSDIGGHHDVDIAPGFEFNSVYTMGMDNIFLEEYSLDKCSRRPLPETEINLSDLLRKEWLIIK
jgi:hypothetical protein